MLQLNLLMTKTEKSGVLLFSWQLLSIVIYNLFLFWLLLFRKNFGVNVTIYEIASLLPVFVINKNKSPLFYTKVLFAIVLSMFFWLRADLLTDGLSFLVVLLLNTVIFQEAVTGRLVSASYFFDLPFMSIGKVFVYTSKAFKFLVSWQKYLEKIKIGGSKAESIKKILVGVLISVPILFILVLLFASADQSFQNLFSSFLDIFKNFFNFSWLNNLNGLVDWVWQFGIFWIYLCLVFPFDELIRRESIVRMKRVVEKTTVVVLVSAVFALFILTQAKTTDYILNGFTRGLLNPSIFVREGFYQLVFACIVGMTVLYVVKRELGKRLTTILLLTEIFLVSLVAGERVWLYQYQYGLTQARVWGMLFLLFVLIIIGGLFLDLFKKINDKGLWQILLLGFSFIVFVAGLINVDHLIAVTRPPVVNGQVDITYMVNNLSYDALDYWINGLKNVKPDILSGCKPQDTPQLCKNILQEFKGQYLLVQNINQFLNNLQGSKWVSPGTFDKSKFCNINGNWLTNNLSILNHTKEVCDNYQNWIVFKNQYESISHILNPTTPTPSTPAPFYSCQTLGTQMVVGNDGRGQIGCDIQVNGQIDLSQSYCEGQTTHIRQSLLPDAYNRPNRYYATLMGLNLNEEVKVFVYTQSGSQVECLPSLNK